MPATQMSMVGSFRHTARCDILSVAAPADGIINGGERAPGASAPAVTRGQVAGMSPSLETVALPALDRPLPASMTVLQGRDAYLAENGFTVEAYDLWWTPASVLGIPVPVLNTHRHRQAIMLHDLHHVVTGYGTDLAGEGEISAWEVSRGLDGLGLYVSGIVVSVLGYGLMTAPLRTVAALRVARGSASLFQSTHTYEELLSMTIGALRAELGLPMEGLATKPRRLHGRAPKSTVAVEAPAPPANFASTLAG